MESKKAPNEELLDLLVEEGAIPRPVAEALRGRLRETWMPIGKILRQKGWLSMPQLTEILQLQSQSPLRLGELACARGYCTAAQIEEALQVQREMSPHALDLVFQTAGIDVEKVLKGVTRYVRTLETRLHGVPTRPRS
jgi:hypothetical protein